MAPNFSRKSKRRKKTKSAGIRRDETQKGKRGLKGQTEESHTQKEKENREI
jgi:hypothetical protein